ncbi:MAG: SpoIIE family protein phosphatase [Planctomycetota bacterium]|nr:SpoIIE family protein phosphatase [Planctomycetota bacterium]
MARLARLWAPVAVLLLALGPIAGWGAWLVAESRHDQEVQVRFEELVAQRAHDFSEQVTSYGEVLHSVQGLYDASEHVTESEFATFTRSARERFPSIEAIAWAPIGEEGDRAAMRVRYVEPAEQRARILHRDLFADEILRPAAERALTQGRPILAPPRSGAIDGVGLLLLGVHDIFAFGEEAGPLGVVVVAFDYRDIILGSRAQDVPLMRLLLYDATIGSNAIRLAAHGENSAVDSSLRVQDRIHVAGRTWRLDAEPTIHFLSQQGSARPLGFAAIVFLLWELFAGLLLALSYASRHHAVRQQGRNVARVLQSLGEGVVVADASGMVRLSNEAARGLIGSAADSVDAAVFSRLVRFAPADGAEAFGPHDAPLARAMRGDVFDQEQCIVYTPNRPHGVYVGVSGRPLRDEWGHVLGGVLALRDETERRRSESSLREKNAELRERQVEMDLAASVQRRLYPARSPRIAGLDIVGSVHPAEETCGDYYDFIELTDGSLLLAIGDVSGHGLGPALVMAETRAYVHSLASMGSSPSVILDRCNDHLERDLADDLFVTLLLIRIAPDGRTLSFASAGHTPALLLGSSGELRARMGKTGPPLGIVADWRYEERRGIEYDNDDVLVLMTDGVTEASSALGEVFDDDGVLEVVRSHLQRDAAGILHEIHAALDRFAGERARRDDVTLVVCKRGAAVPKSPDRRVRTLEESGSIPLA